MSELWEDLIRTYAATPIRAPALKVATLAQWALESACGTSDLAVRHGNFSGLKFRARVNRDRPLAAPVDYEAHDGLDTYCAFASLEDFVAGYWAFVGNGPIYAGWERFAEDPGGYIAHLKAGGFAGDPDYVAKVLSVMPTIRGQIERLGLREAFPAMAADPARRRRVAILVGHNGVSQGAFSQAMEVSEFVYNQRVFARMHDAAPEFGIEPRQFLRRHSPRGYAHEIAEAYAEIDLWEPEAILELHSNAGRGTGSEVLFWHGSGAGRALASAVLDAIVAGLRLPSRGLRPRDPGERGSTSLVASRHPTILPEPFFGDHPADTARMLGIGEESLARAYLIGLRDYLASAGAVA